ncbi:MAG: farnesyl diphosphate synthase [Oscillospiraceae bacterium]|nr:farnesyl diphosphate synthase [Oscillospiraceae bacterium]
MNQEYDSCRDIINARLETYFKNDCPQKQLLEAMRYSLLAGGKRIRPVLTVKFCEAAGGRAEDALDFACAVEMLHTYSLIHDDMPCMDDDDLRRGKPTNHKVFGEYTAVISGDALQAAAFETLLSAKLPADSVIKAGTCLAEAAGAYGMCGGQQLDMEGEQELLSVAGVTAVHNLKTGALLRAACRMGVIAAGDKCSAEKLDAADKYASALGLAFQIRDDILDCTATTEELGKTAGSDVRSEKSTFVSLLGIEACVCLVHDNTEKAKAALRGHFEDTGFLYSLADALADRKK